MTDSQNTRCDLCDPVKARQYLDSIRFDGKQMTFVVLQSGENLPLDDATPEEICEIAHEMFEIMRVAREAMTSLAKKSADRGLH